MDYKKIKNLLQKIKGNVLRLISKIKDFIGSFFTRIKDFIDSFFTSPINKIGAITLISSVVLLGFSFLLLISDQYGHKEALPFAILGYCLFLFVPFERKLKITFSVGLAGVVSTAWVGIVSTDRIKEATQKSTKQIQTTTEKYIEKSTKDIQEAMYPNDFKIRIHPSKGWVEPIQAKFVALPNGKMVHRIQYEPEKIQQIHLKNRELLFHFGIINKSTKSAARDVRVIYYYFKDQFEGGENIFEIEHKIANPSMGIYKGKTKGEFNKASCIYLPIAYPYSDQFNNPMTLTLTKEKTRFLIEVGSANYYMFEFICNSK